MSINTVDSVSSWYCEHQKKVNDHENERIRLKALCDDLNGLYGKLLAAGISKETARAELEDELVEFNDAYTNWSKNDSELSQDNTFGDKILELTDENNVFWTESHEFTDGNETYCLSIYDYLANNKVITDSATENHISGIKIIQQLANKKNEAETDYINIMISINLLDETSCNTLEAYIDAFLTIAKPNGLLEDCDESNETYCKIADLTTYLNKVHSQNKMGLDNYKDDDAAVYADVIGFAESLFGDVASLKDQETKADIFAFCYLLFKRYDEDNNNKLTKKELTNFYFDLDSADGKCDGVYNYDEINKFMRDTAIEQQTICEIMDSDFYTDMRQAYNLAFPEVKEDEEQEKSA